MSTSTDIVEAPKPKSLLEQSSLYQRYKLNTQFADERKQLAKQRDEQYNASRAAIRKKEEEEEQKILKDINTRRLQSDKELATTDFNKNKNEILEKLNEVIKLEERLTTSVTKYCDLLEQLKTELAKAPNMALGDLSAEQTAQMQNFKSQFDELDNLADEMDEDIYNLIDLMNLIMVLAGGLGAVKSVLSKTGGGGRKSSFLQRTIYNPLSRGLRNAKVMANQHFTRKKDRIVSAYNNFRPNISSLGKSIYADPTVSYFRRYTDKEKNKEWSSTIKGDRQLRRKDNIVLEIRIAQEQLRKALNKYDKEFNELKRLPAFQASLLSDIKRDIEFLAEVINGNGDIDSQKYIKRFDELKGNLHKQQGYFKNYKIRIQDVKPLRELCRRFRNLYSAYDKASGDHAIVAATKYVDKYGRKLLGYNTKNGSTQPLAIMPAAATKAKASVKAVELPVKPVKPPSTRTMPPMPSGPAPNPPMDRNQRRQPTLTKFESTDDIIQPIDATSRDSMPVGNPPPVPTAESASVEEAELPEAVPQLAATEPKSVAELNIPPNTKMYQNGSKGEGFYIRDSRTNTVDGTDINYDLYKKLALKENAAAQGGRRRTHKRKRCRSKSSYRRLRRR